jgi:DNA-directed RNA polymerase subunit M/transcription elongation factor TFIIS
MKCPRCNNALAYRDGTEIFGGFPNVRYWYCSACGYASAIPMERKSIPVTKVNRNPDTRS